MEDEHDLEWWRSVLLHAIEYGAGDKLDMGIIEEYLDMVIEKASKHDEM